MVPRLHKKGSSFKGAAAYLLHDKEAQTADRVAGVHTHNLSTDRPEIAWRVMAATAMDQDRLKQEAGVKNTGRKSKLSVLHFSLSWHKDEADELDFSAMTAAAESAIAALGASKHQAIVISHDDEPHPHVHVLLNRVSPVDGRMLSSSKEKLALSEWAEKYEKDRGKIYCHDRVINNAARRRGEYTRGVPSKARNVYEAEMQQPVNDNKDSDRAKAQRAKDAQLAQAGRDMRRRHAEAWEALQQRQKEQVVGIRRDTSQAIGRAKDQVREDYKPRWGELHHQEQASMQAFEQREQTMLGRIRNRFKSIDLGRIVVGDEKKQALGEAFGAMTTKAGRVEAEQRRQQEEEQRLKCEQKQAEDQAAQQHREIERQRLAEQRRLYEVKRSDLILSQQMDQAAHRAAWGERKKQREKELALASSSPTKVEAKQPPSPTQPEPVKAATPSPVQAPAQTPTKASDLLPQDHADQRAQQIEQFKQKMMERAAEQRQQRDQERGDRDR